MSPTLANFLFEAANFLVLAAVLGWLLFKPIRGAIAAERAEHDELEKHAVELRGEAEALTERARTAQERLREELGTRRTELLAAAQREATALQEAARTREQERRAALEREAEASHHAALERLADAVGQVAARSVERLLLALDGPALDLALVRGAIASMEAWPAAGRRPATVESARPLEPEALRRLREVLGGEPQLRVLPELGAGVRVTTPAGQVDGTARALARQAQREVTAATREPLVDEPIEGKPMQAAPMEAAPAGGESG